jgi:hypothetical protein
MLRYEDLARGVWRSGEWQRVNRAAVTSLADRARSAELIVAGSIESVRSACGLPEPDSPFAPKWAVADIRVSAVAKGAFRDWTISVLFPTSAEANWRNAPRLTERQRSVFLLHRGESPFAPKELFTILRSIDVQPLSSLTRVTELAKRTA